MSIKNSLISITVATLLIGCGGSSSSDIEEVVEEVIADKNSRVCLDVNANSICDSGEEYEEVTNWEAYSSSQSLNTNNYPLAYISENGLILTAAKGSTDISPWTTLVNNEIINNPNVSTIADAETFLLSELGLSSTPTNLELEVLDGVILKAINANPNENVTAVLSAVAENIIESKSISADVTVTSEDIDELGLTKLATEELFSVNVDAEIEAQDAEGWIDANDASIRYISSKGGNIVTGSIYHNALSVVDINNQTIKYNPFATLKSSGHGTKDEVTGASENYLRGLVVSTDGNTIYANVPPKSTSSETKDPNTYGLFKADITSDGTIDFSSGTTIRAKEIFSSFQVSNDDNTIVAYDSENYFIVYNKDLVEQSAEEIVNIEAYAISTDNSTIFTAFNDSDNTEMPNYISRITTSSLAVDTVKIALDFTPDEIIVLSDTKLLAVDKGDLTIAIVDLTTNTVSSQVTIAMESNAVSVSPSGKYLVAAGHDDAKILVINLEDDSLPLQYTIELENTSRAVSFIDDSTIAYLNDTNSVTLSTLSDTGVVITLEEKFESAISDLLTEINGGYYDSIISDLSLAKTKNGFDITWSSTLGTNYLLIDSDNETGTVTRPENDMSNVNGVLSVEVKSIFRGEEVTESKNIDIEIRKKPMMLSAAKYVETGRSNYMASNDDGSVLVAPIRFENEAGEDVYGIATYTVNEAGEIAEQSTTKLYDTDKEIIGVGVNASNAIGVSSGSTSNTGNPRIFSLAIDTDGNLADTILNEVAITSGEPATVEWNIDQTIASVMIQKEDGTYITEVYNVNAEGAITLSHTIDMGDKEYKSYGPAVINEDATKVYQRDGDSVHLSTKDGGLTASKEVNNIARVWYGANRVFVLDYAGTIYSYNEALEDEKIFSTGTSGRMYGAETRTIEGKNYLFIPVQRSTDELNGIYQLEINSDGTLTEIAFSNNVYGADRMAVSKDGNTVFYSFTGDERSMAVLQLELN